MNPQLFLLQVGFLDIGIWDVLDVLIVGYLFYRVYKLLKGTVAFYILLGLLSIYALSWLVSTLQMDLLNLLLSQFVNIGVIMLLIIFQPEVRRFLLVLGSSSPFKTGKWIKNLFNKSDGLPNTKLELINDIIEVSFKMAKTKTGALMVIVPQLINGRWNKTGTEINAKFSKPLIESIFNKYSPLHDGAVILRGGTIIRASYVLPLSTKSNLPQNMGLRHRAGIGVTENSNNVAVIISEETGNVSFSIEGSVHLNLNKDQLREYLKNVILDTKFTNNNLTE